MPAPNPAEARKQLANIFDESVAEAMGLNEALQLERNALETQDIDSLDSVVFTKNSCAEKLQVLDRQRIALCEQCGFAAGPDQMQQLIKWCDEEQLLNTRWDQLVEIAAQGNTLNLTNGAIIRVRQQQIDSSLSVLRGVSPGCETYGRNGEESGDSSRRSLAEA